MAIINVRLILPQKEEDKQVEKFKFWRMWRKDVLDGVRSGVDSDYFWARVTWPNGYGEAAKVEIHTKQGIRFGEEDTDKAIKDIESDLRLLKSRVHDLTFEISRFDNWRREQRERRAS